MKLAQMALIVSFQQKQLHSVSIFTSWNSTNQRIYNYVKLTGGKVCALNRGITVCMPHSAITHFLFMISI